MATPLLIKPSLDEVRFAAVKIGLPPMEADKFWNYYESNGWKVGRVKMASVAGAMAGWKIRYEERRAISNGSVRPIEKVIMEKEYERVLTRMKTLEGQYSAHQTWDERDKFEYHKLTLRRDELRKKLGVMI